MVEVLEGVEFRTKREAVWAEAIYDSWRPVQGGRISFPAGTQLRMAPVYAYEVITDKSITYKDKKDALNALDAYLAIGTKVSIKKFEDPEQRISHPLLQAADHKERKEGAWHNFRLTAMPISLGKELTFRIRPDNFYRVTTIGTASVGQATLEFHDVDVLAKYVDNRIRTNGQEFTLTKVRYTDNEF